MSTGLRTVPAARAYGLGVFAERLVLRALSGITVGELTLRLPSGERRDFGTPGSHPKVTIAVTSADLFRRLARRPRLGLGEGYAAGDWRADDLVAFFELLIRNVAAARTRPPLSWLGAVERRRPHLALPQRPGRSRRNIHYHYDIGNNLYELFLDESLAYSCAYFERPNETLEQAQLNKYRRICDKLELGPDDHLLEIGCGWGGFAVYAARERSARVTGLTISQAQRDIARERVRAAGLNDVVEIRLEDYRATSGRFTKIASIEMIEAIGHAGYPTFFAACDRLLAPGGLACVQTIAIPDRRYEGYRRHTDWIREYVFPGSLLPSLTALAAAMSRSSELVVYGLEDVGIHYARTIRVWRERFFANIERVRGLGYDARFERIWELYLAYCEAAFATRSLHNLQLVLTRPLNDSLPRYPTPRVTF